MFLTVMTVAEALTALAPARRSAVEPVAPALGVVPARDVTADAPLPAWARATVDGYAVRASDTYAAAETLPAFLEVTGAVAMGEVPAGEVGPGAAMAIPTGGLLPHGADAVVMVEHTTTPMPGHVELMRGVAPGDGVLHPGEEAMSGDLLVPAGRPLRAADLGLLASAGVVELAAHARPRVGIVSTGDEVVPPATAAPGPGQVRDACAPALAGLVREASRSCAGSCPTTRPRWSACSPRRSPTTTWSWSRRARRSARATSPPPSWRGSARSSATGSRSSRASPR
jgi:molybdopterin molybdotransferase